MIDDEPLLARIRAAPDDTAEADAPRLVYADWLDERADSDARDAAALIRAQCAYHADPSRWSAVARAEGALASAARRWSDALPSAVERVVFHRGLPERAVVRLDDRAPLASVVAPLARLPTLRALELRSASPRPRWYDDERPEPTTIDDDLAALAGLPALTELDIETHLLRGDGLAELARLRGLRTLILADDADDEADPGLFDYETALQAIGHLTQLEALALPEERHPFSLALTQPGGRTLDRLPALASVTRLRRLRIGLAPLSEELRALTSYFPGLEQLACDLAGDAPTMLTSLEGCPALRQLTLYDLPAEEQLHVALPTLSGLDLPLLPSPPTLERLAALPIERLRLPVDGYGMSSDHVDALARWPALATLELFGDGARLDMLRGLRAAPRLTRLDLFDLAPAPFEDLGDDLQPKLTELAGWPLRELTLGPAPPLEAALADVPSDGLPALRRLALLGLDALSVADARALRRVAPALQELRVFVPQLSTDALQALGQLPGLRVIRVAGARLEPGCIAALHARHAHVVLVREIDRGRDAIALPGDASDRDDDIWR